MTIQGTLREHLSDVSRRYLALIRIKQSITYNFIKKTKPLFIKDLALFILEPPIRIERMTCGLQNQNIGFYLFPANPLLNTVTMLNINKLKY